MKASTMAEKQAANSGQAQNSAGFEETSQNSKVGRMVGALDEIERRVEHLREHASALDQEKDNLLCALQMLADNRELLTMNQCDREEFQVNAERLMCRCLTVEIKVGVPRTAGQEEALTATDKFLEDIKKQLSSTIENAEKVLQGLLNACNPEDESHGAVNVKFQSLVLACAVEDQKNIRKKIQKWCNTLHTANKIFN